MPTSKEPGRFKVDYREAGTCHGCFQSVGITVSNSAHHRATAPTLSGQLDLDKCSAFRAYTRQPAGGIASGVVVLNIVHSSSVHRSAR
jgi:hypothetical protein